jgi:hypothetical protein
MGIFTSQELTNLAYEKQTLFETKLFSARQSKPTTYDIFLSHSFLDKSEVKGLYLELTSYGYSVYVDWIVDPQLDRSNVTKASAELIRNRMKSSKSLLLAISTNADLSKWIPWELGFVDGNTNKCAIIPVSKERIPPKAFKGKEYLKLYPFIKKHPLENQTKGSLWVIESEYKYSLFKKWFESGVLESNRNVNIFEL